MYIYTYEEQKYVYIKSKCMLINYLKCYLLYQDWIEY